MRTYDWMFALLPAKPIRLIMGLLVAFSLFSQCPNTAYATPSFEKIAPPSLSKDEAVNSPETRISGRWLTISSSSSREADPREFLHIYGKVGSHWLYNMRLDSPSPQYASGFGMTSAIDGNVIAVAAPKFKVSGVAAGAVFIYQYSGQQWHLQSTLTSPDSTEGAGFGNSVAIDGNTVVVGEMRSSDAKAVQNRGVYVFALRNGKWRLQDSIETPDLIKGAPLEYGTDSFGSYVDVSRNRIAITAMGSNAVFIYRPDAGKWRFQARIDAPLDSNDGKGGPAFGRTLDIDNDTLVVGALRAAGKTADAGAVFVYRQTHGRWHEEAKLIASDGAAFDMFGHWVAHDNGMILTSAFRHTVAGRAEAGTGYVFKRVRGKWYEWQHITPPALNDDADTSKYAGYSVDLANREAVLSAGLPPIVPNFVWLFRINRPKGLTG